MNLFYLNYGWSFYTKHVHFLIFWILFWSVMQVNISGINKFNQKAQRAESSFLSDMYV